MDLMSYSFLVAYCLVANLAVIAAVLTLLWIALGRTEAFSGVRARTMVISSTLLLAWYGVVSGLAAIGVFAMNVGAVPLIIFGVILPIPVGFWLFFRSEPLKAAVKAIPVSWLVAIQVYRVIGFVFLLVWSSGQMPGESALPAGGGDVLVGLLAIPTAWASARGFKGARAAAYAWNYVGILDFVVALAAGFLSSPGPFQVLALQHPDTTMAVYPIVMFPIFAIPLSSLLHGICLWKLSLRSRDVDPSSSRNPRPSRAGLGEDRSIGAAGIRA
jgi:hypothetical protein